MWRQDKIYKSFLPSLRGSHFVPSYLSFFLSCFLFCSFLPSFLSFSRHSFLPSCVAFEGTPPEKTKNKKKTENIHPPRKSPNSRLTLRQASTQLSAPCGRGACRTFSTQQTNGQIGCRLPVCLGNPSRTHTHHTVDFPQSLLRQTKSLLCGVLASEHHDRFLATGMFGEKGGHVQHLS